MTQWFEVGDLVENMGDGCHAIVVDNKVGWVNGEWRVGAGPSQTLNAPTQLPVGIPGGVYLII